MSKKFVYAGPGKYRHNLDGTVTIVGEAGTWVVSDRGITYCRDTGELTPGHTCEYDLVGTRLPPSPEDYGLSLDRVYHGSEIDEDLRGRMLASQEAGLKWEANNSGDGLGFSGQSCAFRGKDLQYRLHGCTLDASVTTPQEPQVAATEVIDQRIAAAFERLAAVWRDKPWNGSACIEFVAAELRKGSE